MRSIEERPAPVENDLLPLRGRVELLDLWFEGRERPPLLLELAPLANLIPVEVPYELRGLVSPVTYVPAMLLAVVRDTTEPAFEPDPDDALRDIGIDARDGDASGRGSPDGLEVIVEGVDEEDEENVLAGESWRRPDLEVVSSSSSSASSSGSSPSASWFSNFCFRQLRLVALRPSMLRVWAFLILPRAGSVGASANLLVMAGGIESSSESMSYSDGLRVLAKIISYPSPPSSSLRPTVLTDPTQSPPARSTPVAAPSRLLRLSSSSSFEGAGSDKARGEVAILAAVTRVVVAK